MAGEDVIYELAARLGSINTFDRHGYVIALESFEEGLIHVDTLVSGTGAGVALSTDTAKMGGYSCKLTAGSDASRYAWVILRVHPVGGKKIGVEFSWALVPGDSFIGIFLVYYTGGTYYYAELQYDEDFKDFEYMVPLAGWVDLETDLTLYNDLHTYHTMKLVVDFDSGEYVRALLDGHEYDLSGQAMPSSVSSVGPFLEAQIRVRGLIGVSPYIYVDNIILTQNEP